MDIHDFLVLCQKWNSLGWAVQGQLQNIMDGAPVADQNQNAVRMIKKFLEQCERSGIDGAAEVIETIDCEVPTE